MASIIEIITFNYINHNNSNNNIVLCALIVCMEWLEVSFCSFPNKLMLKLLLPVIHSCKLITKHFNVCEKCLDMNQYNF